MKIFRYMVLVGLVCASGCKSTVKYKNLHFKLSPQPKLLMDSEEVLLSQVKSFVSQHKQNVSKWVVYLPDDVPIEIAIELFGQFAEADCEHVAVYAEDARGDWPKRDIGVEVGPNDPVRVVTEFIKEYPEPLKKFTGKTWPENLLAAMCQLTDLGSVLSPLLGLSHRKHVRISEAGGVDGLPAERYLVVIEELRELGVRTVSFHGVYLQ